MEHTITTTPEIDDESDTSTSQEEDNKETITNSPEIDYSNARLNITLLSQVLGIELKVQPQIILMQAFSMMSTAIGPAVVRLSEHREEALCLYQMSFLEPSGGKTRSLTRMKKPLEKLESELQDEIKNYNVNAKIRNSITIHVINDLKKKIAKNIANEEDYSELTQEIIKNQMSIIETKKELDLFINPTSTEALLNAMEYDGASSWCVAEGESFVKLIKQNGDETLRNVWNMERTQRTRRTSASTDIREPFLTIYVAMQPENLLELTGKNRLQERGLLSRFLFGFHQNITMYPYSAFLEYNEGWTIYCAKLEKAFNIRKENERLKKKIILYLTKDATELFSNCVNEYMFRIQNDLSCIKEWGGKLQSQLIRIAALFHLYENENAFDFPIGMESIKQAYSLLNSYFIPHALSLHNLLFPNLTLQSACIIANILARQEIIRFHQTEFHQQHKSKFKNASHFQDGIEYLRDSNILNIEKSYQDTNPKGGRPQAPMWLVDKMRLESFYQTFVLKQSPIYPIS